MTSLAGRVALITGGSRGIGRAAALKFAEAGADVIINFATSQTAAKDTADRIAGLGRRAATIKADVSEPEDIASMVEFIGNEFGRLDILVSNAASGGFRPLMEATPKHFAATMNTNVQALMLLSQAALPLMQPGSDRAADYRRKILALSSHGSHLALPNYGLIGASKAALESMARHLALELGNQGINVNVVLAGLVASDSTKGLPDAEAMFQAVDARRLVSGRALTADDVADALLFLAGPESDLIQGQTVVIDGGEALHG